MSTVARKQSGWHAVAVGSRPGVYMSLAEATAGAGDHECPLIVPVNNASTGLQVVDMFSKAKSVVYADGSSTSAQSIAGYGVYWGHSTHPKNVSEFIDGTNNVAELMAILTAVNAMDEGDMPAIIVTDSKYAMDCVTIWFDGFKKRGWTTVAGTPVCNADLIRETHEALIAKPQVRLFHVRGHKGHAGNEAADKLAKAGSLKHRPA